MKFKVLFNVTLGLMKYYVTIDHGKILLSLRDMLNGRC